MSRGAGRGNVVLDESNQAIVLYEAGTMLYVCKAMVGSLKASAVWQVKRIDSSSGVVVTWADGNDLYNKLATDIGTVQGYSYS